MSLNAAAVVLDATAHRIRNRKLKRMSGWAMLSLQNENQDEESVENNGGAQA